MRHFLNSPYFFWAILALPSIPLMMLLTSGTSPEAGTSVYEFLLHPTGEFAARFMIIAMMLTPLRMLMPKVKFWAWMVQRRRYLGVAAFLYALAHTVFYIVDRGTLDAVFTEFPHLYIWTGWLAFLIFVPLAITSTDGWVRRLGRRWKVLQRTVYGAAILTLIHWAALHEWGGITAALLHFVPLGMLQVYRISRTLKRRHVAS